jgi:hypothetical protein
MHIAGGSRKECSMRRLIAVIAAAATLAVVGAAPSQAVGRPERDSFSFSFNDLAPAGELCDFDYRGRGTITVTVLSFTDANGDVTREVSRSTGTFSHKNLDTGYTLTERLVLNGSEDYRSGTGRTVGIQWHLKSPDGHGVLTVAGRLTYTLDPFEIISITPRVDQYFEFPETICPALGGEPA